MKHFHHLSILFILLISASLQAQNYQNLSDKELSNHPYWIGMMQDHSVNFYDVQRAFGLYWENREVTKGSGWKPFKRWEYLMSSRILPDGTRPAPDREWNAYFDYISKYPEQKSANGNWVNLGPYFIPSGKGYKGLGRLNAIAFHPTDANTIYVGAPAGGLWISYDGGQSWDTQTDILPTLGISSILVDYTNPDIIYLGTGDRDAGDAPGLGLIKSTDGGQTWEMMNQGMGECTIGRLIMHPQDPQTILAATNTGIYKTTDGGQQWDWMQSGNFKEIVFKSDNPDIIYAAVNGNFYRSADGGENWDHINNGLPSASRGVIAVTPDNPEVVYFLLTTSDSFLGLYRSTDAGLSFSEMSDSPNIMSWGCEGGSGGQAWYDLDIAADPLDEYTIYAGGVNCFKSTDGGITWEISSHWWGDCGVPSVHADLHVLEYNPVDGRLYAGNDGGIYWTDDGGTSWHEISDGLSIGQVYKIGQSATVKDKVINGYQDNGTSTFMGTNNWINNLGGDGMECAVDHENALYSYGTLYYGDIFRILNNGSSVKIAGEGTNGITESGAWVTPFLLDAANPEIMYVGYKNIWKGRNIRSASPNWTKISENLGGNNSTNMRVLEQSPVNTGILYAARDDKKLFRCDDINSQDPQWVNLSNNLPTTNSINDLECDPWNEEIVYMTQGTKVYKSTDKGNSWEDITRNLPNVTMNDVAYYVNSIEGLYLGTDIGIFYTDAFMEEWMLFDNGFPASGRVTEVEIYYEAGNPEGDMIRAATYGRGLWESDMYHATPVADFQADQELVPPSCPVNFTDLSAGVPTGWSWEFEGGNPAVSTERHPSGILFEQSGSWDVTLTITNEFGTDTRVYEDLITVSDQVVPTVNFSADQQAVCSDQVVYFHDLSTYCPTMWEWEFQPGSVEFVNGTGAASQNPEVRFLENTSYTVSLTASNANGENTLTQEEYIHAGGFMAPFSEGFEDGFDGKSWTVLNPDDKITWQITSPGWAPEGTKAAFMNFFDYYLYYQRDDLISPPVSLYGIQDPVLNFSYAYAQRYSQVDSLIVEISTDCGETWERLYANGPDGTGIFATSGPTAEYFNPASSADWCGEGYGAECVSLDLSAYQDLIDVQFKFQSFNKIGNNLYLDNISIPLFTGTASDLRADAAVNIHPNPGSERIYVRVAQAREDVVVMISNLQGKQLLVSNLNGSAGNSIDISKLQAGAYILQVIGDAIIHSEILIVK